MTINTAPEILDRLTFNLSWWTDEDVRKAMNGEYLLDDFVFDDVDVQSKYMQHKADMISDYYNDLFLTTQYQYNPIDNVDESSTITKTINGTRTHTRDLNLTDTRTPNLTTSNDGVKDTITNGNETTTHYDNPANSATFNPVDKAVLEHMPSTTTREGSVKMTGTETTQNTGTDTTTESYNNYAEVETVKRHGNIGVTSTQQLIKAERDNILNLKMLYLAEFADYFMITM